MKQYHDLCQYILDNGIQKGDRTGTGTISIFGYQTRFNLKEGFPLLTTKRVPFRLVASELLWFLTGSTNIQPLLKDNNHIWDDWPFAKYKESTSYKGETMQEFADKVRDDDKFASFWGKLGPVYGHQWRSWKTGVKLDNKGYLDGHRTKDQISEVIEQIKNNPNSRRLLVNAWNVADIDSMALPPCHYSFQFYVADGKLSLLWNQR